MSDKARIKPAGKTEEPNHLSVSWVIKFILGFAALTILLLIILIASSPLGRAIGYLLNQVFALNTVQTMWYITRASGLVAYILLWLSTAWGLAVSSKILDQLLHRTFTYDFHQYLSLFAIGFTFLHGFVLLFDGFLPFTIPQILVPFMAPYRSFWVGIGIIALYLMLLVTVTFYIRSRIGMKTFRAIHALSLAGYLFALGHSIFSGSDSSLWSVQLLYFGSFLIVVFLASYWLISLTFKKRQAVRQVRSGANR